MKHITITTTERGEEPMDYGCHDIEVATNADGEATSVTLDGHRLRLAAMDGVAHSGDQPQIVRLEVMGCVTIRGDAPLEVAPDDVDGPVIDEAGGSDL